MCLFCRQRLKKDTWIYDNDGVYVIFDGYPVTKGHCLIITKRHVENYFDTTKAERKAIDDAIFVMKKRLDQEFQPDGYNIGVNISKAAGQSIMHVHIHVIPRYTGDMKNPKGGIRGVIPEKQNY